MIVCNEGVYKIGSQALSSFNQMLNPEGERLVKIQRDESLVIVGKQDGVCESRVSSMSIAARTIDQYGRGYEKICVVVDSNCTEEHFNNERNKQAWAEYNHRQEQLESMAAETKNAKPSKKKKHGFHRFL
jgi:hypothetical protein